ncbi:proprotein convertase subtilisin/kexin type 4 [Pleurodeles waltl]|uniref:proprotein convertase subtilisin/kexin type 4 n=1 Tax=Pleurodeles waltl TaxID=8319 RepID=UPI003709677B
MRGGGMGLLLLLSFRLSLGLRVFTNSWAARVLGGPSEAARVAQRHGFTLQGQVRGDYYHLVHRSFMKMSFSPHRGRHLRLKKDPLVYWFEQQTLKRRRRRHPSLIPTDPLFHKQWYMNNDVIPDLNVLTAWSLGYTGRGVVVTILDDGLEKDHPDLMDNYDPLASYDFNGNDPDPQPRYDPSDENRHGTRCAGEVAAVANNGICGAGIAYGAKIGGVRMLDGVITDIVEAQSLSLRPQHIHIYSASWGPEDDGKTVDGPGVLAMEAFYRGIVNGRGGLGSIFVWASGNGGFHYDNCNCDGYTNSIYTLSVGSTTEKGNVPWYSEACASTLTSTYSSGVKKEKQIVTTDLHHRCTEQHTGTSASAPLASGIIALALEANPALTWRDMQHLVVRASRPAHLQANDWVLNGVGRKVSHHYGYGLLDAGVLVDLAKKWETVRPQRRCFVKIISSPQTITSKLVIQKNVTGCAKSLGFIRSLEHVQARMSLSYSRRGDLEVSLVSPRGTRSVLVALRPYDTSTSGYKDWVFMTTHNWDEDPQGVWTLELVNKGDYSNSGLLQRFTLLLYGTEEDVIGRVIPRSVLSKCLSWTPEGMCVRCSSPFFAFGKLCLSYCPPRYYRRVEKLRGAEAGAEEATFANRCAACHPSCYTCRGGSSSNCTACAPFSVLDAQLHSCSEPTFPRAELVGDAPEHPPRIAATAAIILGAPVSIFCLLAIISWLLNRAARRWRPSAPSGDHQEHSGSETGTLPESTAEPTGATEPPLNIQEGIVDEDSVDGGRRGSLSVGGNTTVVEASVGEKDKDNVDEHTCTVDETTVGATTVDKGPVDEGPVDEGSVDEGSVDKRSVDERSVDDSTIVGDRSVNGATVDENTVGSNTVDEGTVAENTVDGGC